MELDFNITKLSYQNALTLAYASQWAYESEKQIRAFVKVKLGLEMFQFFESKPYDTQGYIAAGKKGIVVAFRGTQSKTDWLTDLNAGFVSDPYGKVHRGFQSALNSVWAIIEEKIKEFQINARQPLLIIGHSLGGALAMLAAARFLQNKRTVKGLYTFGQPRVGNKDFSEKLHDILGLRTFRFINNSDIVPRVPSRALGYCESGSTLFFNNEGILVRDPNAWTLILNSYGSKTIKALERYKELEGMIPEWLSNHDMGRYISLIKGNKIYF